MCAPPLCDSPSMRQLAEARELSAQQGELEEQQWVQRAQAGDPQALDWLVRRHVQLVRRRLTRILGSRQDLDDLVQITFVETLGSLSNFRRESSLSTFITGIAVRVARRAMRPTQLQRHSTPLDEEPAAWTSPADERVGARQILMRVRTALERVSEPKRVAFLLWALEGMTLSEVAEVMDASIAATQSRVFYAQKELLSRAAKDPLLREWLKEQSRERR